MYLKNSLVFFGLWVISCQPHTPVQIPDFQSETFKTDRGACENKRINQKAVLEKSKAMLLGVSENEIFSTLGRYDYQILDKKNEKAFVYFLEKGPQCLSLQNKSSALCMHIQFNSISLVKEIRFIKASEIH